MEELIKITFVGYYAGKTSFLFAYSNYGFTDNNLLTTGTDIFSFNKNKNGINIKLKLYDTGGNERFQPIAKSCLKSSNGGIIMYNIIDRPSFETAKYWINEIKEINIPAVLVANLCDLEEKREISIEEGEELAKKNNLHFYETSNKLKININEPVDDLIDQILKIREEKRKLITENNYEILDLKKIRKKEKENEKEKEKRKKEKNLMKIFENINYVNNNLKYLKY